MIGYFEGVTATFDCYGAIYFILDILGRWIIEL